MDEIPTNSNAAPPFSGPPGPSNPRLLMTHSSPIPSFQRRTVDSARQLRDNFSNVFREIQPLVETARTVNAEVQNAIYMINRQEPHSSGAPVNNQPDNSFVINVEGNGGEQHAVAEPHNGNNNSPDEVNPDRANILEVHQSLNAVLKYMPFVIILLMKTLYDSHESIFVLIILFGTFVHANSAVKRETTKRHGRSLGALSIELLYILACSLFVHYYIKDEFNDLLGAVNLVVVKTFIHPLTVGSLLWVLTVTDFALKLITVTVKILLTMLPGYIVSFKKRGKMYLFIEAVSQMYRSLVAIHPWLNYLLESYQGPEKIVAVFLSAFYMISKGADLVARLQLIKTAFLKLLQNVAVGSSPSKEEIQVAGEQCPICHDEYDVPVLLQCRHIFCESCVTTWFDREQTCPLCRAKIVDDPSWRDGSTSYFIQLY